MLHGRLVRARHAVIEVFETLGIEIICQAGSGLFLWRRIDGIKDALPLAGRAMEEGLLLAPGTVFRPNLEPSS